MSIRIRTVWMLVGLWWVLAIGSRASGYEAGPDAMAMTRLTFFALMLNIHAWRFPAGT